MACLAAVKSGERKIAFARRSLRVDKELEVMMAQERVTGFWLRLFGVIMMMSLALVLVAVLVGQRMEKRVLALLSAPAEGYWQIDLLDVDRGIQHALTRDNNRFGFMWSPDGQKI